MPIDILATKVFVPTPPSMAVRRQRLIERLNNSRQHKLVLLSAPAGFGKTTLVSAWLAEGQRPVAWLSLDEGENDPARFLSYLIAALQSFSPDTVARVEQGQAPARNIGEQALRALHSPQPPSSEAILTALVNDIAAIQEHFTLVLDDYHLIEAEQVDRCLRFLVEHLPAQMHLVIATREDPPLPLARLRARGQLTELRAADLRFTTSEAAEFLNQMMKLNLSADDVAALEARTEGWITGLQLAALSMQGRNDIANFIQAFTGSHRFVLDYLVEEVLQHQPDPVRSFLLQTCILERLCAPLCNAVTEREDGIEMLEALERGNLFLIPLDDRREWYRYHHLFADVLQTHLLEAQPDLAATLHRRASTWYEENGLRSDAIHHALAAQDFTAAAALIELAYPAMDLSYQSAAWLGWARALPDEVILTRPVLQVGFAWALLEGGELEASEIHLQEAERWLKTPSEMMVVVDREQYRSLPATIAIARAYRSLALGIVPDTVKYARLALDLTPEDDQTRMIQAISILGLAQYASGDLQEAEQSLAEFNTHLQETGEILVSVGISFLLGEIRVALGRLHQAASTYQQAIHLATTQGEPIPIGTADLYRGLSEIYIEWGNLETAEQHLSTSQKLGKQITLTDWPHRLNVSLARFKEAQGDLDEALKLLDEAERAYVRSPLPDVHPVAAMKRRIWLKQGRLAEALGRRGEQRITDDGGDQYIREFETITLARALIARFRAERVDGDLQAGLELLGRLLRAAEEGGRNGSVIEILTVQALAYQAQGNQPSACAVLERALALAEPEGYIRMFVDEGEALQPLLKEVAHKQGHPLSGYAGRLLEAFTQKATGKKTAPTMTKSSHVEPLSERELEVLKLLHSDLSGPEIAGQLVVSLNTLRTHTKNIYAKLGVNNRRAAIHRAEELNLI